MRRLGYNPFVEVAQLLSEGQPTGNAHIPTLEIHIAVLRKCLEAAAVPYIEIPPRPDSAAFLSLSCPTHDVWTFSAFADISAIARSRASCGGRPSDRLPNLRGDAGPWASAWKTGALR